MHYIYIFKQDNDHIRFINKTIHPFSPSKLNPLCVNSYSYHDYNYIFPHDLQYIYSTLLSFNIPSSFKDKYAKIIKELIYYIDINNTATFDIIYLQELSNKMSFEGFHLSVSLSSKPLCCILDTNNLDIHLDIYQEIYID